MKKVVALVDILMAVLFGVFSCIGTMSAYTIGCLFFVIFLLIAEVLIILYALKYFKFLKWFVSILTVSTLLICLPNAFILVSLSQYKYLVLLIMLFIASLFRVLCSFRVR